MVQVWLALLLLNRWLGGGWMVGVMLIESIQVSIWLVWDLQDAQLTEITVCV